MKRRMICSVLVWILMLSGCATTGRSQSGAAPEADGIIIVTTTYPVYLFASAVIGGVEGIQVERLNTGEASCLHDYTMSVDDMKKLEAADVIVMNGAGLEDFMEDALATSTALVIDCSQSVKLLESRSNDHEEGGEGDPHIWMDPANAAVMVENIQTGLAKADPDHAEVYLRNAEGAVQELKTWDSAAKELLAAKGAPEIAGLITFHDGFQYFARAYELPLLAAIEEEAGSEASAQEIQEMTTLVEEKKLPVIFTEVNGSDATAKAIARETGCQVAQLTMMMDGPDSALSNYGDDLMQNIQTIINGFQVTP
ncbi:MAG: metal ABC transporter substrate-binding protein [Lawsonibacter sp.]|nr:metal ABC transporter substrate-binding protein [Lawsonibacter sp.]